MPIASAAEGAPRCLQAGGAAAERARSVVMRAPWLLGLLLLSGRLAEAEAEDVGFGEEEEDDDEYGDFGDEAEEETGVGELAEGGGDGGSLPSGYRGPNAAPRAPSPEAEGGLVDGDALAGEMRGDRVIDRIARGTVSGTHKPAAMPPTNDARLAAAVAGRGMTKASRGMREGTPDPIGMWQDATTLFGEEKYREAEAGWHTLAKLLAPDAVDAAFNYALCLERQDRYFEATMVWEKILMANRDAYERAQTHVETLVSLMARDLGVLSAGAMHPDPEVESRRRKERKRAGLRNDGGGKAGGKGGGKGGAFGTPPPPPIPHPAHLARFPLL